MTTGPDRHDQDSEPSTSDGREPPFQRLDDETQPPSDPDPSPGSDGETATDPGADPDTSQEQVPGS